MYWIVLQIFIKNFPLHKSVDYCLRNYINLTLADAYEVLKAADLNGLLKFIIDWLKRETISKQCLYYLLKLKHSA